LPEANLYANNSAEKRGSENDLSFLGSFAEADIPHGPGAPEGTTREDIASLKEACAGSNWFDRR